MKILILCTGNSCRSQMAQAFLQSYDKNLKVFSAGTEPANKVNPFAIQVMNEVKIDISKNKPNHVNQYLDEEWDYVITVCGGANETCPAFIGKVKHRWHLGYDDPAEATGTDEEKLVVFRKVRDEIKEGFKSFYNSQILGKHECGCC
ncbi:MAG: protein tyrosine phosphatase [Bacteroidetes bacterium GWA2_31_9b]|nr:MAG: protein tyrosine phosphatase [Bacteroidetes bacterium GWA2_31_9b]